MSSGRGLPDLSYWNLHSPQREDASRARVARHTAGTETADQAGSQNAGSAQSSLRRYIGDMGSSRDYPAAHANPEGLRHPRSGLDRTGASIGGAARALLVPRHGARREASSGTRSAQRCSPTSTTSSAVTRPLSPPSSGHTSAPSRSETWSLGERTRDRPRQRRRGPSDDRQGVPVGAPRIWSSRAGLPLIPTVDLAEGATGTVSRRSPQSDRQGHRDDRRHTGIRPVWLVDSAIPWTD